MFFAVYVEGHDDGGESPEGDRQLVGVEEVVEDAVDVICQQGESECQCHAGRVGVFGGAVDAHAGGEGGEEQQRHQCHARHSLLGHGTYVFAVGVAQVAGVGADGRELVGALVAGVEELVGARAAAEHGLFFPHAEGRRPAVQSLEVRGIGRNVGDALHLVGQRVARVLLVLAQLVEYVALVDEEQPHAEAEHQHHPLDFHAHADEHVDADGSRYANPCRAAVAEEQANAKSCKQRQRQHAAPAFHAVREDEIEGRGQHQRNDAAVGRMVVVEGFHDAVQRL